MKTEDLQAIGLDEEQIKKVFELNGKDVNAEKRNTEKAAADRDNWKARAETAEQTLKGFDGVDVEKLNKEIEDWKTKAEQAEKDYQQQIYNRDFDDALNRELDQYKFTSTYAKKAVIAQLKEEGLKLKDGKIVGLSDVMESIKKSDASAFASENPTPKFTQPPTPTGNGTSFKDLPLSEKMKFANEHPTAPDVIAWLKK